MQLNQTLQSPLANRRIVAASTYTGYADYVCDGVADQVQIQQAIDSLGALGGTVELSPGVFNLTVAGTVTGDTLTTPYCVRINASHGPITLRGNFSTFYLTNGQVSNAILLLVRGASGAKRTNSTRISGIEFYSDPTTQTAWTDFGMLQVAYADNVKIDNNYFHDSPYFGCQVFRSSENSIFEYNRVVYSAYGNGYRLEILTGQVLHNVFEGSPSILKTCLDLPCNSDIGLPGDTIQVLGNLFKSGYKHISLAGQRNTLISGNVLYGATHSSGVSIAVSHYSHVTNPYSCMNCSITNNILYGVRQGITITGNATHGVTGLIVANNQIIENTAMVNLTTGIIEDNIATVGNNLIVGNRIIGATTGINAAGASANGTQIRDNVIDTSFGGHTHIASNISDLSEAIDDRVAALIQNGTGITWSYDDTNGTLTPSVTSGSSSIAIIPMVYDSPTGSITWASMPQALTEFNGATRTRTKVDLTGKTQARITLLCVTGNASVNTPVLGIQYSTDQSTWNFLDDSANPVASVATGGGIVVVSSWINLAANAKADVFLRVIGQGGNGSSGTVILSVALQVK